jgi:hypothetical protein
MAEKDFNGYELSRAWFDYSFQNPEKIKPIHSAIYFFAIEHCNRLGWKDKFGFPSQMVMEAIGVKNWRTYSKALNDLVDFGFIKMIEISKNQYSSNIIAIVKNTKAHTKALDKALSKHSTKQSQSTVSIDKQTNKEQLNKEQRISIQTENQKLKESLLEFIQHRKSKRAPIRTQLQFDKVFKKLQKISQNNDSKAIQIIDESIANGWTGLFEIQDRKNGSFNLNQPQTVSFKNKI